MRQQIKRRADTGLRGWSRSAAPIQAKAQKVESFEGQGFRSATARHSLGNIAVEEKAGNSASFVPRPNRTGLPDRIKHGVEKVSGISLDDVRVHYNSPKPAAVAALAYAQGEDIYVGPREAKYLAHEAWHLVQQKQGRVKPTLQVKGGMPANDDPEMEREASVMGNKAMAKSTPADHVPGRRSIAMAYAGDSEIVQRVSIDLQPDLIFGTDGRRLEEMKTAVACGYRRFDCAESYKNTKNLAQALNQLRLERSEYEIIYKFDLLHHETPEMLEARLKQAAEDFNGYLDVLMIHNLDAGSEDTKNAWDVLQSLKTQGITREVGLSNITPAHAGLISGLQQTGTVDVIENTVRSILTDADTVKLIRETGAKVYYYDVVKTAREAGVEGENGIQAIIYSVIFDRTLENSAMILSSGSETRQAENLNLYGQVSKTLTDEDYDPPSLEHQRVDAWAKSSNVCQETDYEFDLDAATKDWLGYLLSQKDHDQMRKEFKTSGQPLETWITQNPFQTPDLKMLLPRTQDLKILLPKRRGVRSRFYNQTLLDALVAFFNGTSCERKSLVEVLQVFLTSGEDWGNLISGFTEIVDDAALIAT